MTEELKTLKDFVNFMMTKYADEKLHTKSDFVWVADIRQEAIKWVKFLNNEAQEKMNNFPKEMRPMLNDMMNKMGFDAKNKQITDYRVAWIKMFFDITEEELK